MTNNDFSPDDFDKLLDDFIASQLDNAEDDFINAQNDLKNITEPTDTLNKISHIDEREEPKSYSYDDYLDDFSNKEAQLAIEELRLYNALMNLIKSSIDCAKEESVEVKKFNFNINKLIPRFSPKKTENIKSTIVQSWELLIQSQPTRLSSLPLNASDEQILNFAEKTTNKNLMMALISYVECLIEMDACEIAYNMRKVKYQKYKIEKKIYEEEMDRKKKIRQYIQAIKEQNFPIDAELLVTNYFKTVRKDPDGAKKMIETNPANFAPIQTDKLPNKFFGLIKARPEDGKKINKKLGEFIKKLKI